MTSYVANELRRLVESRACFLCEYCLIDADDTFLGCQVDHVIAEKHGGITDAENLCLACTFCNRSKGSDIGSITAVDREFVRFFNPRVDRWNDHFALDGDAIVSLTTIGEVTARILAFNSTDRLLERAALRRLGRYPSEAAQRLLNRKTS